MALPHLFFSLTLCCLPPSLLFLVSGFLDGRTFSRISQKLDSDEVFRKGKVHQSFFGRLTTRLALFHPLRSEMLGSRRSLLMPPIQVTSTSSFTVCAAAAMASAFAYLLALFVGISAAAAISCECTLVPECAILSSGYLCFRNCPLSSSCVCR